MGLVAWGMGLVAWGILFSVPSSLFLLLCSFFPVPSSLNIGPTARCLKKLGIGNII
jgi:hypothetical protein